MVNCHISKRELRLAAITQTLLFAIQRMLVCLIIRQFFTPFRDVGTVNDSPKMPTSFSKRIRTKATAFSEISIPITVV